MDGNCCASKQDLPEALESSVRKATFPFDEDGADVTLRTSNNVEFRVHRVILSLASSVFKDMFSMPQPCAENNDPIAIAEDDKTLDIFLRICYPILNPKPISFDHIRKVLAAAIKYDAPLVVEQMKDTLWAPEFLDEHPLVVFTIACIFHMEELAQAAAETSMTGKWSSGALYGYPKLDDISAGAYFRLLQLRHTRTTVAVAEPSRKRGKKGKGIMHNATVYGLQNYAVSFQGIVPFCRPPLGPQTLPPTKTQFESVSEPFKDTTRDLVLRTSDGFDFYVHRNILVFASPTFFDALVAVEMEDRPGAQAVCIYQVQESAAILDILLRLCYPIPHFQPTDPDVFLVVLFAAHKYGMSKAKQILRDAWPDPELGEKSHMRLYFAAVVLGWMNEAKACANRLASLSMSAVEAIYVPEMESICSVPYRNLLLYINSRPHAGGSDVSLQWGQGPYGLPSC